MHPSIIDELFYAYIQQNYCRHSITQEIYDAARKQDARRLALLLHRGAGALDYGWKSQVSVHGFGRVLLLTLGMCFNAQLQHATNFFIRSLGDLSEARFFILCCCKTSVNLWVAWSLVRW